MTPFKLLMIATGLSQREAASYLNVSASQVDKMSGGTRTVPEGIMTEMRALHARQQAAAREILDVVEKTPHAAVIELGLASDDYEAQTLGWPCVGAQAGALSIVVASADRTFKIVPRGSTPATALAADVHGT